jgi:glycerol kinase
LEGSVFVAGAAVQWLRDGLGLLDAAPDSEAMAQALEDNAGVYFVPSFVGLGAPHWEPEARGMLVGLTRGTTKKHLVRAALEAMAYGTAEVLAAMEADSGVETTELRVDGGASTNGWLMQLQADVLDIPVRRPALVETTALGAAGLAGIATGVWQSAADFLGVQEEGATLFEPSMDEDARTQLTSQWDRAVRAAIRWAQDV